MSTAPDEIRLVPLREVPIVEPGQPLAPLLDAAAKSAGVALEAGVLVVCQKVVSKSEGRVVDLRTVEPSEQAKQIAARDDKDPRQVELVLRESQRIIRHGNGVLITETKHGFVCANSGVDLSNAPDGESAVLLPLDSDASARRLKSDLEQLGARNIAVIVSDTFGRPWREALVDVAIGVAGIEPIADARGGVDLAGRELQVTAMATADQLAAAAGLLMVKDAAVPAVWIEGIIPTGNGSIAELLRDPEHDLFR